MHYLIFKVWQQNKNIYKTELTNNRKKRTIRTKRTITRKKLLLGVGTSSYLSVEEARLKLLASKMNLARACIIIGSVLLMILENCRLAGRQSTLDKARSVVLKLS